MIVLRTSQALEKILSRRRKKGLGVGFVPTMGALHQGHLSLVRRARKDSDLVVVSIFVNPRQFGPKEDLRRYPRNLSADARLLKKEKADLVFAPDEKGFYSDSFQTEVEVTALSRLLCGRTRPIHFKGVATVVAKLLQMVRPERLYLGQKDFQQCRVIEQMIEDLSFPVRVVRCPIVRESDGLAMSSRNVFLSSTERREAAGIHRALTFTASLAKRGEKRVSSLEKALNTALKSIRGGRLEYAQIVDSRTLRPVVKLQPGRAAVAAVAMRFAKARLIDNEPIGG